MVNALKPWGLGEKGPWTCQTTQASQPGRAQRQGKAARGCGCSAPHGSPTSLLRGCPAHAELPETFPTHNTNQCYHLLFRSSGNDPESATAPPTMATPPITGKEQKLSVSPFRGQTGVTQSQGALQPPQAGTSAPARFSLSSSPRGDRGAQIKAVTALHSPLFPCWPLLQGESVGEDLKRVLFSCLVPLPPAPVPGARGSLQLRCPGQAHDRAEQGVVAAAVWSTGREGAGAHASMGLSASCSSWGSMESSLPGILHAPLSPHVSGISWGDQVPPVNAVSPLHSSLLAFAVRGKCWG